MNNAGNMVWGRCPRRPSRRSRRTGRCTCAASFNTLHAAWPHFLEKNYGRVVLTTSVGMFGLPDNIGYAIAKASMIGMAKSLTVGRGKANIAVNCIAPNAVTRLGARAEARTGQAGGDGAGHGPGAGRPDGRLPGA